MKPQNARLLTALHACEQELDARNALSSGGAARRRARMSELVSLGDRFRIVILGRRGCGKSSLLNALSEQPLAAVNAVEDTTDRVAHYDLRLGDHLASWFDTPGLSAGGELRRGEMLAEALQEIAPDVLLLLVQASEVDAGIRDDLRTVQQLYEACTRTGTIPRLLVVVTKVDELAPPDVFLPPFDDEEKQKNIRRALEVISAHVQSVGLTASRAIAINAYVRFRAKGEIEEDLRWNLDVVRNALAALAPHVSKQRERSKAMFDKLLRAVLEDLAMQWSSLAAASARRAGKDTQARSLALADLERVVTQLLDGFVPIGAEPEGTFSRVTTTPWQWFDEGRAALRRIRSEEDAAATKLGALCRRRARWIAAQWNDEATNKLFAPDESTSP